MSDSIKRERDRWIADVRQLIQTIDGWAKKRNWSTHWDQKQISESKLGGEYTAPYLIVQSPQGRIHVDPVARYVAGRASGRVDLLAWPSMRSLMLVRTNDQWVVKTESGIRWPQSWSEETFVSIVNDALLSAA